MRSSTRSSSLVASSPTRLSSFWMPPSHDLKAPSISLLTRSIAGQCRLLKTSSFVEPLDGLGVLDDFGEFANVAPGGNHRIGGRRDVDVLAVFFSVIGFRFARHPGKQPIQIRLTGSRQCRVVPAEPSPHWLALENLAKQVVLIGLQLIAVVAVLVGIHQRQRSHRQVELALAHAESLAHCIRITVKVRKQPLHCSCTVDGRPASFSGDVMEPHHHKVISFTCVLVENDG